MPIEFGSRARKLLGLALMLTSLWAIFYASNASAQAGLPPGACNGFTASAQAANGANDVARAQALKRNTILYQNCTRAKQLIDSTRPPPPSREELAWASANSCEAVTTFINNFPRSRHATEAAARKTRICTPPPNCTEYERQARAAAARHNAAALNALRGQTRNYQACTAARNAITAGLAASANKAKQKEAPPPQIPPPEPIQTPAPEPVDDTAQTTPEPPVAVETVPVVAEPPPVVAEPTTPSIEPPPVFEIPAPTPPIAPIWLFRPIGTTSDGGTLYYANDFEKAAPILQAECGQQNWGSCATLAAIYGDGLGVAIDFDRAFSLSRMSCDNEIMLGCVYLGQRYLQSGGTDENNARSAELFKRGCDAGEPDGCNALAEAHRTGTGVARNSEMANTLYARAAQGFRAYCNANRTSYCGLLGVLYLQGFGVEKDETLARALFRQGCDGKDQPSCFMLGTPRQGS